MYEVKDKILCFLLITHQWIRSFYKCRVFQSQPVLGSETKCKLTRGVVIKPRLIGVE